MDDVLGPGRLDEHPFPALAGRIFREGRSGELSLVSGARRRCVWFLGGNPVAVVSDNPQDHVAQFLLEHGRIDADDARRLALLPETREGVGSAGFLAKESLNWGVKFRFVNLCYDLFRWQQGEYAFREGNPPKELFLLKVPAHSLIFKGIGHLEPSVVAEAVPDASVFLPGPVAAAEARYLGPDERGLLEECRPGRTVAEALSGAREDGERARRSIYAFACLGLIALARETSPAPALDPEAGHREAGGEQAHDLSSVGEQLELQESVPAPPPPAATSPAEALTTAAEETRVVSRSAPPEEFPSATRAAANSPGAFTSGAAPDSHILPGGGQADGSENYFSGAAAPDGTGQKTRGDASIARSLRRSIPSPRRFHLPRLAGIAIGATAALVIVGAAWRWMSGDEVPPPEPPLVSRPAAPPASPPPQRQAAPAPPPRVVVPSPPAADDRYRRGLEAFRAGDLKGASTVWEPLLAESRGSGFTVQLLTACQRETIQEIQRALEPREIFLVGKTVNGRDCYRVCLGRFSSRESAAGTLAGLPGDFRSAGAMVRTVSDVLTRDR